MNSLLSLLLLLLPSIQVSPAHQPNSFTHPDLQSYITTLSAKLQSRYWPQNQKRIFPFVWERKKGLYGSTVRMNYVDKKNGRMAELFRQQLFKIDDMNMFVTNFVLYGLLEAK